MRTARRLSKAHGAAVELPGPASDEEFFKSMKKEKQHAAKKKRKESKRKRRSRSGHGSSRKRRRSSSTSSSPTKSSSSSDSMAVFRKASAVARAATRSQREALTQPHLVLVDTLTEMSRLLPRATVGATLDRAEIFKTVPPLFVTYFKLILESQLQASHMQRNEREARTLCEILDWALKGETMKLVMVALGRLKAIETVIEPGGSGWNVARHHELIPRAQSTGMLTSRDRENVARDVRDEARTQTQLRGAPGPRPDQPPPRTPPPGRRDQGGGNR